MKHISKALTAALGTAAATLGTAMLDGQLTSGEGLAAIGTGLVVGFAAWRVPDTATPARRARKAHPSRSATR